jgi:hypothetical protein
VIVDDGMCGEYTYFGIGLSRYDMRGGSSTKSFECPNIEETLTLAIDCMKLFGFAPEGSPKLLHFIHVF